MKALYAILLDGGFLTKKLTARLKRPVEADDVVAECSRLQQVEPVRDYELLRIYDYDAFPCRESVRKPITKAPQNLADTNRARQAQKLFDQLLLKPNFALRMGEVKLKPHHWRVKQRSLSHFIAGGHTPTDDDFELDISQKGVDMRIGMDMARLALRELVRAVIVVTADSDFVPAFKFVRREGVKVILDPMGHNATVDLKAHADVVL